MAQTYYLSSLSSDLSGGADFNRKQVSAKKTASSIVFNVAFNSTEDSFAFTEPGIPGSGGATGDYSVVVKISANNSTGPSLAIAWARVDSSGTQQAISSFTSSQAVTTTTQVLTFSATAVNLGTWAVGDRLKVVYRFINTAGGGRQFTVETGTANAAVTTAFNYTMAAGAGSFALSGPSVALNYGYTLSADEGDFQLTGQDIDLTAAAVLAAGAGSFTLAGQTVGMSWDYPVAAGAGAYVLTGQDVGLTASGAISAAAGVFVLSGTDVALKTALYLQADSGAFTLTGVTIRLSQSFPTVLSPVPAAWALTAANANSGWLTVPERYIA